MMNKKLFKSMLFTSAMICLLLTFGIFAGAKTVTTGDFKFDVTSSGATLTEYTGSDTSVTVPSKVNSVNVIAIGGEAFWQNKTLQSVSLPSTLTSIGYAAFNECSALKKVVIPSKVTSIGDGAFWYCTSLKSIVIPKSVSEIGKNVFKGCDSLTAYTVKGSYGEKYIKTLSNVKLAYRYATSLTLSSSTLSVGVGSVGTVSATLAPTPLYNSAVTYTTSDSKIATVDSKGNITGVGVGTATITVTANDGSKKSAKCTVTVIPAKVSTIKASTLTISSAKITWSKVNEATGYKLYKYDTAQKKYVCIATTTKLSYTDSTAKIAQTPKYKVRAYTKKSDKTYYGSYSSVLTVTMPAPGLVKNLSATVSTSAVKLSWEKADTATGYRVYQYDSSKKQYVKKTTITALTTTIKSLNANTEYTFAVKAYYKDSKGNVTWAKKYQTLTTATKPLAVSGFSLVDGSESFDRISFKWQGVDGVTGYQIYCIPENGETIKKSIVGCDITQCTMDSLNYGTQYTLKIRSYTKRSSGTTFSSFSSVITAQTLAMPGTAEEAFDSFVNALNVTKNYTGSSALYKNMVSSNFAGENSDKYQLVYDNAFKDSSNIYVFQKGLDDSSNSISAYIPPLSADCALTKEQLVSDSITYKADGSGYEITFYILPENAEIFASQIDVDSIKNKVDNFSLSSNEYKALKVTAKVQGGFISHMTISQDMEIAFKIGVRSYSFTQTVETLYAFVKF